MTLGDKLSKLRKENNYTQEQLAEILGVSRQAISKWESNIAYPETEKLLKLGELYNCSMDYLMKGENSEPISAPNSRSTTLNFSNQYFERVSEKKFCGLPLWHINIGLGRKAKGIIAIGFTAKGIVSIGLFSIGILSFGVLSAGILAFGAFVIGLFSLGAISLGVIALGAVSVGIVSLGAMSIGQFSVGALAVGKYFAKGDHAIGQIALGDTKAVGSVYQKLGKLAEYDITVVNDMLDMNVPSYLSWAKDLIKLFIKL